MWGYLRYLLLASPPLPNAPEKEQHEWQWAMFVWILLLTGAVGVYVAFAESAIPGIRGHATGHELDLVSKQLYRLSKRDLEMNLLQTREKQCIAIATNNAAAKLYISEALQQLQSEYHTLTKTYWRIPDCSELV